MQVLCDNCGGRASERKNRMKLKKTTNLKIVERPRPEPYSMQLNMRVRPSEKAQVKAFADRNGVTVDTVMRSALVAAGILAA